MGVEFRASGFVKASKVVGADKLSNTDVMTHGTLNIQHSTMRLER